MKKKKQISKIIREYKADELGLPVIIKNVPVIEKDGMEIMDIDYSLISQMLFTALIIKPMPLTGAEVRFMRLFLGLTLSELAKSLHVTHPTIIAWEKHLDAPAKIIDSTELLLRLFAAQRTEDHELVAVLLGKYFTGPTKSNAENYVPVVELNIKSRDELPKVRFSKNERDLQFLQTKCA